MVTCPAFYNIMANANKIDPTRTVLLRRAFVADMVRRFKALSLEIQQLVVNDDAFGLQSPGIRVVDDFLTISNVEFQAWRFQTNPQKVKSYRLWLKEQVDAKILTTSGGLTNKPWTAPYIESAYKKGVVRAFTDTRRVLLTGPSDLFTGGRDEFLRSAFSSPEALSKVELLYERAFTELQGVTSAMDQQMSRILAEGLSQGQAPATIARSLRDNVTKLTNTRAKVIARTEIIRAHSEGQLDAFEVLGVKELGVQAEWITAGDDRVCVICQDLEGQIFTVKEARGLMPAHPNCFIDGQVPIYTSKGWVHIRDIKVGMLVLTHKKRFRKVTELIRTPKQRPNIVQIYLKNSKKCFSTLTVTEDHPVMLNGSWMAAKEVEAGMTVTYLASKCKRCEELIPQYKTYCSSRCCSLDTTDKQWASEEHRKNISDKSCKQMNREYAFGFRVGSKIIKAAHKVTKQMAKEGKCPLSDPKIRALGNPNTKENRAESSFRMMLDNPMDDPSTREKMAFSLKKFYLEHPEKHPNVIMAKKGFISSLEKKMKVLLEELDQEFIHQFPIDRYFADFVLPKYKLVIEVDGHYWHQDSEKDSKRTKDIENLGWMVVRFDEDELKNGQRVKKELTRILMNHDGEYNTLEMKVLKVKKHRIAANKMLFNFSVEEDESYIAKGFVVHNCRCAWIPANIGEKK